MHNDLSTLVCALVASVILAPHAFAADSKLRARNAAEAPPPAPAAQTVVPSKIEAVQRAYDESLFEKVEPLARELSENPGASPEDRERALDYLWRAQFYLGKRTMAVEALARLLQKKPKMRLDPDSNPPLLVEFFDEQRRWLVKKTKEEIEEEKREEEAALARYKTLRAGGTAALIVGSVAVATAVATLVAGQVLGQGVVTDIATYNNNSGRTLEQHRALLGRMQQVEALDISTIVIGSVGIVGVGAGIVLMAMAKPPKTQTNVQVTNFSIGPGTFSLAGRF